MPVIMEPTVFVYEICDNQTPQAVDSATVTMKIYVKSNATTGGFIYR